MKSIPKTSILAILVVVLLSNCTKKHESKTEVVEQNATTEQTVPEAITDEIPLESGIIFETTKTDKLTFSIAGNGAVILDLENASAPIELQNGRSSGAVWTNEYDCQMTINAPYGVFGTVKITGEGITHFKAEGVLLTSVNVSKSPKLTWLNVADNQLTSLDIHKNTT